MNGLDKPSNLLSDFFDAAFVNQAELLTFDRWDELTARISERTGVLPIAFLLGDCNPSTPNHWIRQQTKAGKIEYFEMTYRDNPEIYDQETGELTETGKRRVEKLRNLEGMRYKRGYEGGGHQPKDSSLRNSHQTSTSLTTSKSQKNGYAT